MPKKKQTYKVQKLINNRIFDLTQEQLDLWKRAKISIKILESPVKDEDIPDVLKGKSEIEK